MSLDLKMLYIKTKKNKKSFRLSSLNVEVSLNTMVFVDVATREVKTTWVENES